MFNIVDGLLNPGFDGRSLGRHKGLPDLVEFCFSGLEFPPDPKVNQQAYHCQMKYGHAGPENTDKAFFPGHNRIAVIEVDNLKPSECSV